MSRSRLSRIFFLLQDLNRGTVSHLATSGMEWTPLQPLPPRSQLPSIPRTALSKFHGRSFRQRAISTRVSLGSFALFALSNILCALNSIFNLYKNSKPEYHSYHLEIEHSPTLHLP
jgi:hypothetical protein